MLPKNFKPSVNYALVRLGKDNDGGYLINKESIEKTKLLLSFGISDDFSFESDFKKQNNCPIIAFDPTTTNKFFLKKIIFNILKFEFINFLDEISNFYNFKKFFNKKENLFVEKKIGIGGSLNYETITFDEILLLSKVNSNLFLKIDIEGSEYRILDDLVKNSKLIVGIAIEFHDVDLHLEKISNFIEEIDLDLVHIHANNYSKPDKRDIPTAIELTFARNPIKIGNSLNLPHKLDQKNDPNSKNIDLFFTED